MPTLSLSILVLSILLFAWLGQWIARKKGLNPVFWSVMGASFGPLMLPFLILAKSRIDDSGQNSNH